MQHQDLGREMLLKAELSNLRDEGCRDSSLLMAIEQAVLSQPDPRADEALWQRIDVLNAELLVDEKEPSDLEGIRTQCGTFFDFQPGNLAGVDWYDKVYGAWLARCAGCTLGKPVEGWTRGRIRSYLEAAGAFPLKGYIPVIDPFPQGLELWENYSGTTLATSAAWCATMTPITP